MADSKLVTLLIVVVFFFFSGTTARAPPSGSKTISINWFIWRSCKATLYHHLCYASLISYATDITNNPVHLATFASNVSLKQLRLVTSRVVTIHRSFAKLRSTPSFSYSYNNTYKASLLVDCMKMLHEAEDLTVKSTVELKALSTAKGMDIIWKIGNAQTWMSAAITYEDTCTDGISSVRGGFGKLGEDVISAVNMARDFSSNALALVNSFIDDA
ncbi:Pectinesterase [Zostera marina]|uniref:Pectinesterase n=1 Tax=Zostera marina TaxID=29655 RepID=A0A0K9Q0S3_ZOSMR|nr:Pectinesterase [Zostera marina]